MSQLKQHLELLLIGFALLTGIMLYGNVAFSQQLIVVSLTTLGMYYLMSGALVLFDKRVERVMRFLYFVGMWSLSFGLLGLVFRLRFWVNGENVLMTGFAFGAVVLLVAVIYRQTTPRAKRKGVIDQLKPLINRLAIYPLVFVGFYLLPTGTLYTYFGAFRHHPAYVEKMLESHANPSDTLLQQQLEEMEIELSKP